MAFSTLRKLFLATTQRIHRQQLYKWMDLVTGVIETLVPPGIGTIMGNVSTLAAVLAAPGPAGAASIFVAETAANYEWFPGDATTINGWSVLGHTGGAAGRWKLQGDRITLSPIGGTSDDWPRVMAAAAACAYQATVILGEGTWLAKTRGDLTAGMHIRGASRKSTIVLASLTPTGGPTESPFYGALSVSTADTLTATPAYGASAFTTNLDVAVGSWVWVVSAAHALVAMQYQIVEKNGGGESPFSYEVDRPILFPFATGDAIRVLSPQMRDVELSDLTITGTGDRAVEISAGYRCRVHDITIDTSGGAFFADAACSFDIGSLDCTFERVNVSGGATASAGTPSGILVETAERVDVVDCLVDRVANTAFLTDDCVDCHFVRCTASLSAVGFQFADDATTIGCFDCTVSDSGAFGHRNIGFNVGPGARLKLSDCSSDANAFHGFDIGASGAVDAVTLVNCSARKNVAGGVVVRAVATNTYIQNLSTKQNGGAGVDAGVALLGECVVNGWSSNDDGQSGATGAALNVLSTPANAIIRISNFRTVAVNGNYGATIAPAATGRVYLSDGNMAAPNGINHTVGGVCSLRNVSGSGAGTGYTNAANCTLRQLGANKIGWPTPFTIGGTNSRGTLQLNGATPVAYSFPDIIATDPIKMTLRTRGGTVGPAPALVTTAGTGFAAAGTALDTSTYDVDIGE